MSYTVHFAFDSVPGQTVYGQLLDTSFATSGSALTTGITEVGNNGHYGYVATMTDAFEGFIKFYVSGDTDDVIALFAITPRELSPFNAVFDNSETGLTLMTLFSAALLGKTSAGVGGWTARDLADAKNRIVATIDSNGYRTAVTTDAT